MRYALAALFALHGLIHFLGVANVVRPGSVPQLTHFLIALPPRVQAVGWGAAGILFLAVAVCVALKLDDWWHLVALAALVSQAMVIAHWPDAKAGTVVNVIAMVAAIVLGGLEWFDHRAAQVRHELEVAGASGRDDVVRADEVKRLPPPIARWLTAAAVVGHPRARVITLVQQAELRTSADGRWNPVHAEQSFSVEPPGFAWHAQVSMFGVPVRGLDQWVDGHGRMEIRLGGVTPVVNSTGAAIDEGSLLRWLGEMVWFPSAAVSAHVSWTPIDDRRARATMRYGGAEGSAEFTIDEQGHFVSMEAQRFFGGGPDAKRERWFVPATSWRRFEGIEVPETGEVTWKLSDGDFTYFRYRILDVRYDAQEPAVAMPPRAALGQLHAF